VKNSSFKKKSYKFLTFFSHGQNIIKHEKIIVILLLLFFFFEVDKEFPTKNFIELILNIYVSL
jgi:hypothetical protein